MQAILSLFKGCVFSLKVALVQNSRSHSLCTSMYHGWNSATRFFIGNNRPTINYFQAFGKARITLTYLCFRRPSTYRLTAYILMTNVSIALWAYRNM